MWPVLLVVGGMVLLFGLYASFASNVRRALAGRATRYGLNALVLIVLILGVIVLVGHFHRPRAGHRAVPRDLAHRSDTGAVHRGLYVLDALGRPGELWRLVTALTALVVLLFASGGVAPGELMAARALFTVVGGGIALAAYRAWPTWERTQVPEALARLLDAYRTYFQAVRDAYLDPGMEHDPVVAARLDRVRQAGRLARTTLEPGRTPAARPAWRAAHQAAPHRPTSHRSITP